jgi:hypothetical protein
MAGQYTDVSKASYPELIVSLLENAFGALRRFRVDWRIPELRDPGLKGHTIKTSITEEEFQFFLNMVEESLGWAREALDASNECRASEYWRKLFGPSFPLAEDASKSARLLSAAVQPSGLRFPDRPLLPRKPEGFA